MKIPEFILYKRYGGALDADKYQAYSRRAWNYIDYYTGGRISVLPDNHTDAVRVHDCVFELVEQYAKIDDMSARMSAGTAESETVGSYTVHYKTPSADDLKAAEATCAKIVNQWLWRYIYRGVRYV